MDSLDFIQLLQEKNQAIEISKGSCGLSNIDQ